MPIRERSERAARANHMRALLPRVSSFPGKLSRPASRGHLGVNVIAVVVTGRAAAAMREPARVAVMRR